MTLFRCNDGLMGDFLGIIPVMIALSLQDRLHVHIHPEAKTIFRLIPKKYGIQLYRRDLHYEKVVELPILHSFAIAESHNYYMSSAHFAALGLPVPAVPPKAELEYEVTHEISYDYVLAPFSRSLPPEQRWPRNRWQELTNRLPEKSFCVIGHEGDESRFISGSNVFEMYGYPLTNVINVLKRARSGLISVVSGPSHLAFHLDVKNYLLTNQPSPWGVNPDAVKIQHSIPALQTRELIEVLQRDGRLQ